MRTVPKLLIWVAVLVSAASLLFAQSANLSQESNRAKELMAAGRYVEAVALYQNLVKAVPGNPGLIFDLGLSLHMAGRERDAIRNFEEVLRLDPGSAPASLYLGYAYLSLGEMRQALSPLEKYVRANPRDSDARSGLAGALESVGRFREAARDFRALATANPASATAWYGLGQCYQSLSQSAFERLQKIAPGSAYWLALVAESNAKAQKYGSAFYLYQQALAKHPGLYGAHAALAQIYRSTGHPGWAAGEMRKEHDPGCAHESIECDFLADRYEKIVSSDRENPETFYWKSKAYDRLALQAFDHLSALPNSPELHELLARLHDRAHDFPAAVKEWREAYALSHEDPAIGGNLALDLIQVSDYQRAERLIATLLSRQPDSAELNYLNGHALLRLQRPAESIRYLERAIKIDPALTKAQGEIGTAYVETGQSANAIPHLRAALPADTDGSIHYQLAKAYLATGQRALAAQMLRAYQKMHRATEQEAELLKKQAAITPP